MRRRIAATVLLVTGSAVLVAGCDGELRDTISSAVPTDGIALPSVTIGEGGNPDQSPPATQTSTATATATTTATATATATPSATDETDTAADTGVAPWAWVLLGLVLLALVVLVVMSARRRRAGDDKALAAQADGQIGWARANTDDALVRWRADQLAKPVDQRDTDSELARRWTLLDERLTAATTDLLTLESSSKDDGVRETATALREAAERFRTSIDGLAQSVVTGEQSRIAAASQALTADTTLLDQARQRLRQAAKL